MVADFRDTDSSKVLCGIFLANPCLGAAEIPQDGIWGTALFPNFDYCDYKVFHQNVEYSAMM
jgi:hypothetical protein